MTPTSVRTSDILTTNWLDSTTHSPEEGEMLKRRDNKTKRRPQEDKQDKNMEEWKRKD